MTSGENHQKFIIDFSARTDEIKSSINTISKYLSQLKVPDNIAAPLAKDLTKVVNQAEELRNKGLSGFTNEKEAQSAVKIYNELDGRLRSISEHIETLRAKKAVNLIPDAEVKKLEQLQESAKELRKILSGKFKNDELKQAITDLKALKTEYTELEAARKQSQRDSGNENLRATMQHYDELVAIQKRLQEAQANRPLNQRDQRTLDSVTRQIEAMQALQITVGDTTYTYEEWRQKMSTVLSQMDVTTEKVNALKESQQQLAGAELEKFRTNLAAVMKVDVTTLPETFEELSSLLQGLQTQQVEKVIQILGTMGQAAEDAKVPLDEVNEKLTKVVYEVQLNDRQMADVSAIKSRIERFLSLSGAMTLVIRQGREIFQTMRELDATMAETAVVTDFDISNMWEKFPEYTANATKLGLATNELYKATTLYYQQGLQGNDVMDISVATLKMAAIAGLDAAESANRLTGAMRGFNMEVNATSAEHVADVYSKLAAITASNVNEISTAMSKTASLAASANMSFENTAAFLSTIIETTRESAETAGTALKTVIARFSEIKENPNELLNVEGEEVSFNKVDEALRTVGISLNDYVNGIEGLDSVFLKLAEKWNTLDLAQQRYIATMAAGSRQQSRFIALMQNYARTSELAAAANNANGDATAQYEKTLESFNAKLNQLKDQWQQFWMTIMNSEDFKALIDVATALMTKLNELLDILPDGAKRIAAIGTAFAAWKGAGKIIEGIGNKLKGLVKITDANGNKVELFSGLFNNTVDKKKSLRSILSQLANKKPLGNWFSSLISVPTVDDFESEMTTFFKVKNATTDVLRKLGNPSGAAGQKVADFIDNLGSKVGDFFTVLRDKNTWKNLGKNILNFFNSIKGAIEGFLAAGGGVLVFLAALVAVVVAATIAGDKMWKKLSNSEAAEKLTDATKSLQEATADANEELSELTNSYEELGAERDVLDGLTRGTVAWYEQLDKVNTKALELAESLDLTPIIKDGIVTFKEGDYEAALQAKQERAERLAARTSTLNAIASRREAAKDVLDNVGGYKAGIFGSGNLYGMAMIDELPIDQLESLLNDIQSAGIILSDGLDNDELKDLQDLGKKYGIGGNEAYFKGSSLYKFIDYIQDYADKNDKNADIILQDSLNGLQQSNAKWESNISAILASDTIEGGEKATAAAELLAASTNDIYNAMIDEYSDASNKYNKMSDKELATAMETQFGEDYYYKDDKAYYDAEMTQEISDEAMRQLLIMDTHEGELNEALQKVTDVFNAFSTDSQHILSGIFNGSFNGADLDQYGTNAEEILDAIVKRENYESSAALAEALDLTTDELSSQMEDAVTAALNQVAKSKKNIFRLRLENANKGGTTFDVKALAKTIESLNNAETEWVDKIYTDLSSVDAAVADVFIDRLGSIMDNTPKGEEARAFIESLDFSKPIDAAKTLNEAVNSTNSTIKNLVLELQREAADFISQGNQLRSFVKSEEFSALDEQMQDFIEDGGEITAANIEAMADSCEDLKKLLKESDMSAAGLATAFTKLTKGEIVLEDLTDRMVAFLAATDTTESNLVTLADKIANFDPGLSASDQIEKMYDYAEALKELIDYNAFGDPQTRKYLELFLSPSVIEKLFTQGADESFDDYDERVKKAITEWSTQIDEWTNNHGIKLAENIAQNAELAKTLGITRKGYGDYQFEDTGFTYERYVEEISNALNISTTLAETYLQEMAALSPALSRQWDVAGLAESLREFMDVALSQNSKLIVSEREVALMADTYNMTIDEVKDKLNSLAQEKNQIPVYLDFQAIFTDANGNQIDAQTAKENLIEQLKAQGQVADNDQSLLEILGIIGTRGNWDDQLSGIGYDINELTKKLENLGLTAENTQTIIDSIFTGKDANKELLLTTTIYLPDEKGELVAKPIAAATEEQLQAKIEKAEKEADATIFANELEPSIHKAVYEGFREALNDLEITLGKKTFTVHANVEVNTDQVEQTVSVTPSKKTGAGAARAAGRSGGHAETSLLGEEGPEIVWNKERGYSWIAGVNGPEFGQLHRGDSVFDAEQTRKILSRAKGGDIYGSHARATYSQLDIDASKADEAAEELKEIDNSLDKLYNLLKHIEKLEHEQTVYQKQYENMLKLGVDLDYNQIGMADFAKNRLTRMQNLADQYQLVSAKASQREDLLNSEFGGYGKYFEYTDGRLVIDYTAIDSLAKSGDQDAYSEVTGALSRAEGYLSDMYKAEEELYDIQASLEDIRNEGRDEYLALEERVAKALKTIETRRVDQLEAIYDAVTEANANIVDKISEQIDDQRNARQREKAATELDDKRRQLAYLKQDSSGSNILDIKSLEKEIAVAEDDYLDSLVDQQLTEMTRANAVAEEQRQMEIQALREIIKWNEESGEYTKQATNLIGQAVNGNGEINVRDSQIAEIIAEAENWDALSTTNLNKMYDDLSSELTAAIDYASTHLISDGMEPLIENLDEDLYNKLVDIESAINQIDTSSGKAEVDEPGTNGKKSSKDESEYEKILNIGDDDYDYDDDDDYYYVPQYQVEYLGIKSAMKSSKQAAFDDWMDKYTDTHSIGNQQEENLMEQAKQYARVTKDGKVIQEASSSSNTGSGNGNKTTTTTTQEPKTYYGGEVTYMGKTFSVNENYTSKSQVDSVLKNLAQAHFGTSFDEGKWYNAKISYSQMKKYAKGGLADFTGPAWLDGTPSRPEAVLNPDDTKNFIELRDILRSWANDNVLTQNTGANYYDIDINVDEIADDYDVDMLREKIEAEIVAHARYRNVNAVKLTK